MRLFQGNAEGHGRILEGDVFSHLRVKLFDHGKLALQCVVQDQNDELRPSKNVRINQRNKLNHFVVVDITPHIAHAMKAESRRTGQKQLVGKPVGDRLRVKPNTKFWLKDRTIFSTNQRIDIVFGCRRKSRVSERSVEFFRLQTKTAVANGSSGHSQ